MRYCTSDFPEGKIKYSESDSYIFGWTLNRVQPEELLTFFNKKKFTTIKQIHSSEINYSSNINKKTDGDGIIHNDSSSITLIRTADCVPLFFWSDFEKIAGILHSGWRSFQKGIVSNLINNYLGNHDLKSFSFLAGPSISGKCYEVGQEVKEKFDKIENIDKFCTFEVNGKYLLDIKLGIKYELISLGIPENNITLSDICTHCEKGYHSYRKNKTENRIYNFVLNK